MTTVFSERRKPRALYAVSMGALVFSAVVVGTLFWLAVRSPVRFTAKTPVKVLTPRVHAGHSVTLLVDYCKEGQDIATVGTLLARRGVMIPLSLWPSDLPVGCHKVAVTLPVPPYVSPNRYVLYMVREYRPNVFTTAGVSVPSEPFEVLGYDGTPSPPIPFNPDYEDSKYDKNGVEVDPWSRQPAPPPK